MSRSRSDLVLARLARGRPNASDTPELATWVASLQTRPNALDRLWSFASLEPLEHSGQCSWIGACALADGTEGVMKLAFPYPEGRDEIAGLEACDGEPTVRVLRAHRELGAMLLETLLPGHPLSAQAEFEQDEVIGDLLQRLRRVAVAAGIFRPLADLIRL